MEKAYKIKCGRQLHTAIIDIYRYNNDLIRLDGFEFPDHIEQQLEKEMVAVRLGSADVSSCAILNLVLARCAANTANHRRDSDPDPTFAIHDLLQDKPFNSNVICSHCFEAQMNKFSRKRLVLKDLI